MTVTPWFKSGVPIIRNGVPVLCAECPCPPPTCEKTYCQDTDETNEVVSLSIAITVPDELWVYSQPIDPNTGEPEYLEARKWTGLSAFSGTYTVNRSRYTDSPSCTVTIPSVTHPVNWEEYHGGTDANGCPDPSTYWLDSSGTTDMVIEINFFPSFPRLTSVIIGLGGVVHNFIFEPDQADPFYGYATKHSCPSYSLTGRGGGFHNCIPATTSSGTVTVTYG